MLLNKFFWGKLKGHNISKLESKNLASITNIEYMQ